MSDGIYDKLEVNEDGIQNVQILNLQELKDKGVNDILAFTQGILDAQNNEEFNDSSDDYIKGYKYGKTGKF